MSVEWLQPRLQFFPLLLAIKLLGDYNINHDWNSTMITHWTMLLTGMLRSLPSNVSTSIEKPVRAWGVKVDLSWVVKVGLKNIRIDGGSYHFQRDLSRIDKSIVSPYKPGMIFLTHNKHNVCRNTVGSLWGKPDYKSSTWWACTSLFTIMNMHGFHSHLGQLWLHF